MKKILAIITILFLSTQLDTASAQSGVGTTAAPFLTLGVGAKASALGHANTVTSQGAEGLFWNPATIAVSGPNGKLGSLYLAFNQYLIDTDIYSTGIVIPLNASQRLGLSINFLDHGRQIVRTVEEPEGNGATFASTSLAAGVSFAQNLTSNFYFGGTAKYIREQIYDMSASTFAFDFGFILITEYLNGMSVGATISNFALDGMQMEGINAEYNIDIDPTNDGNNTSIPSRLYMNKWEVPLSFRFGIMVPVIKTNYVDLLVMTDAHQTNDNDLNLDSGTQLSYKTKTVQFHVRGGYRDLLLGDRVDSNISYGAGVTLKTASGPAVSFDFAQVPYTLLGNTTMIDFKIHF